MRKIFVLAAAVLSLGILSASNFINFNNQVRPDGLPLVVPQPRHYAAQPGKFVLPAVLKASFPDGEKIILQYLNAELKRFSLKAESADAKEAALRFELAVENVPDNDEGYTLDVTEKFITVRAKTNDGLFYGAVTLCNILRNLDKPEVPGCHISDYPTLPFRCYTMTIQYVPSKKLQLLKKTIDTMAKFKFNRIFLEVGEAFPYKSEKFANAKNFHSREVLQDFTDYCNARHIKIVPSLQVLSHNRWMTSHADWEKMKEGEPNKLWNSQPCIQNEEARRITINCLREQIEFFKADVTYIYMDEIVLGPFRSCPRCKDVPAMTLLKDYMKFLRNGLKDYKGRLIFSNDTFCAKHDRRWPYGDEFRKELNPATDIVGYWDYKDTLNEDNISPFKEFKTIGTCITGKPLNVQSMTNMIKKYDGVGARMTHWYFSNGGSFTNFKVETPDSLGGFPQGSEYLWNCEQVYHAKLTYDGVYEMLRNLAPEKVKNVNPAEVSRPLALERSVNTDLSQSELFPKFSNADLQELKKLLAGRPERYRLLTAPGGKYFAMCLAGSKGEEQGRKAILFYNGKINFKSMNLLTTTSRPWDLKNYLSVCIYGPKRFSTPVIGNIIFKYEDGKTAKLPLRFRCDLTDWGQIQGGMNMRWAVRGVDIQNRYFSFGSCKLVNPRPDVAVKEMVFSTAMVDGINPVILAVSLNGAGKMPALPKTFSGKITQKPYTPVSPEKDPAIINSAYNFKDGISPDLRIFSEANLSGKLRTEVVEDSVKGKVLKITVPPAESNHPHGLIRVHVNMPFDYEQLKAAKGTFFNCKVLAEPGEFARAMEYFNTRKVTEKLSAPGDYCSFIYRVYDGVDLWQNFGVSFTTKPAEDSLKGINRAHTRRLTFYFNKITKPAEIYIGNIGYLNINYDFVPEWTTSCEREQHP